MIPFPFAAGGVGLISAPAGGGGGGGSGVFVGATSSWFNASTYTVSQPAGVLDGDLLIFIQANGNLTRTMSSTPSSVTQHVNNTASEDQIRIYSKVAVAADTSHTFQLNTGDNGVLICLAYRSVTSVAVVGALTFSSGSTTTAADPITTAGGGVVIAYYSRAVTTLTVSSSPASFNNRGNPNGNSFSAAVFDRLDAPAGSTGSTAMVWTSGTQMTARIQLHLA